MTSILKVDNIQNSSGTAAMAIDGSSNVTFPQNATITGNTTISGTTTATGKITSTAGITFGSDTSAVNALHDYEEGTFTPTFESSGSTFQFTARQGIYTKIGNRVCFTIYIQLDGGGNSFSGNQVTITGLPFPSAETMYFPVLGRYVNLVGTGYYNHCVLVNASQSTFFLRALGDNVPGYATPANYLSSSSGQVWTSGSYLTNS